jgi:4-hydroxy-3-methylbut-2-enyl diphosphate reductase
MDVYLAAPRGFCAGVDRAIQMVEIAIKKWGAPIYVRHEIVHNKFVVEDLKKKGAVFIEEVDDCPVNRPIIFSAHGVAKTVVNNAQKKNLIYVDATCPLVSKVHIEAERHFKNDLQIVMIGHEGHPETIGTMGQLPEGSVLLVEDEEDVKNLMPNNTNKLAYITQTTLSVDDTSHVVTALKERFPSIVGPHKEDICYATTNRQKAVKEIANKIEALLVIGSPNSSNSQRLVEVGKKAGCKYSQLIDNKNEIDWRSLHGIKSVGITAGASAPEILIDEVIESFKSKYNINLKVIETAKEDISFKLPKILRENIK